MFVAVGVARATAPSFGQVGTTPTGATARLRGRRLQGGDTSGIRFIVAKRYIPALIHILAIGRRRGHRFAVPVLSFRFAALINFSTEIEGVILADNNVVTARIDGVALFDDDPTLALVAKNFQAADHACAVQIAVVQLVLLDDVMVQRAEVLFGEELTSEEPRAAEAFQAATDRAGMITGVLTLRSGG